jgi:type 1 glutamine amidotransferase
MEDTMIFPSSDKIKTAVITGNHPYEVPQFINMFRSLESVDFYPQYLENFAADLANVQEQYDVVLFYNMHMVLDNGPVQAALEKLGATKQGIFCLHHGILSYPDWSVWSDVIGIPNRHFSYHPLQTVHVENADPSHPITQGLQPWEIVDETYKMDAATGPENHVLLTTKHPLSLNSLAWTRKYRNSPVFCLASGHGKEIYDDASFRKVVERGILWAAGRI